MSHLDTRYMKLALSLGRRGQGRVWPNPAVGCVIVSGARIVGRGSTQAGGRPHAEPVALAQAGAAAKGATAYVTLEPCAHFGKTPPCAQALIDAGIARVVAAVTDSDPRVSGAGFDMLRAAGIEVVTGVCAEEAQQDHAGFFLKTELGRPFVTLKLALSLDGRIATSTGDSQWITGPQARRAVHAMRARHDAVMVGGGTARADDPSLTVRGMGDIQQPVRVVLARHLDVPLTGILARTARDIPVWMCHGGSADALRVEAWQDTGAQVFPCAEAATGLDLPATLQTLGDRGLTRVFCEGGGQVAASLLAADLVDQLVVYSAGVVIGGDGLPGLASLNIKTLSDAPRFALRASRQIGADIEHIWQRA